MSLPAEGIAAVEVANRLGLGQLWATRDRDECVETIRRLAGIPEGDDATLGIAVETFLGVGVCRAVTDGNSRMIQRVSIHDPATTKPPGRAEGWSPYRLMPYKAMLPPREDVNFNHDPALDEATVKTRRDARRDLGIDALEARVAALERQLG